MFRRQAHGWLIDEWDNLDIDVIYRSLKILNFYTESYADSVWQFLVSWEPEDLLEARERQKMALARYARQSLLQWSDVPVGEIRAHYNRLRELMEKESAPERE